MNFITITSKVNLVLIYCLQTQKLKTEDVNDDFYEDKSLFDFSGYLLHSNIIHSANKTFIGNVKDEFKGKIISEFVGLKSRMYSLVNVNGKENKKSKGINKIVVKNARHKIFLMFYLTQN